MKRLFIILLFLSSASPVFAEESKIIAGMPVAAVEDILNKNGYEYGITKYGCEYKEPFGLQMYSLGVDAAEAFGGEYHSIDPKEDAMTKDAMLRPDYLFCGIDPKRNVILAICIDRKTRKVQSLFVHYQPVRKGIPKLDSIFLSLDLLSVTLTPETYTFVFKKESNQPPENPSK